MRAMRFGSGSYDVRASEGIDPMSLHRMRASSTQRTIACTVLFLDGTEKVFHIERGANGDALLDAVYTHLELVERDFFGLQFVCVLDTKEGQQKKWLEPKKAVRKQMICPPYYLFFRVKFYVSDPSKLTEEYTRYHFFLQIRKDIADGRLPCPEGSQALLASYAAQSELGDQPDDAPPGYLDSFVFSPSHPASQDTMRRIAELHRLHRGQSPAEAEFNFLDHAKRLDLYGVDLYDARDGKGVSIQVGVNAYGVIVFHEGSKVNEYPWCSVMKISFKRKQFYLQIKEEATDSDATLVFIVPSPPACKQLWKSCIEHHTFFRLIAAPAPPPKSIFNIGSRYRYSGRTEFQTMEQLRRNAAIERKFHRSGSKNSFMRATVSGGGSSLGSRRSLSPSETASPDVSARMVISNRTRSVGRRGTTDSLPSESSAPSLRRRGRETTFGVSQDEASGSWQNPEMAIRTQACASSAAGVHRGSSAVPPAGTRKSLANGYDRPGSYAASNAGTYAANGGSGYAASNGGSYAAAPHQPNGYSNGYQTNGFHNGGNSVQRFAVAPRQSPRLSNAASNSPRSSVASHSSLHQPQSPPSPTRHRRSPHSKSASPIEDALVTVRMRPDAQGRFGFNVKGGADQNYPVIVSRVAAGSSADKCYPRLNEGDQVLMINGRDVSDMSHDQVVAFIRSAREVPGAQLELTIRPNVYRLGDSLDEPSQSLPAPATARVGDSVPRSDRLAHALRLIEDSLRTGKGVEQFEMLYRKKPGLTMNDCRTQANINKNRYRDVCPYDATRVILNKAPSGDYINASFVNMDIPSSGIVNRYIACQGPLAHTCADFWMMAWEQLCTTIVMLTTTVERGRVKCHQYWPRLHESTDYGRLNVTCVKDRETPNCSYREFMVRDRQSGEERRVSQMQYSAWPDHGVPDDPKHFIEFVDEVRRARAGSVEPIIVHCSAGIGRTGVLILMETAACLVEANEPVYPLDIVRTMRDQRAMAIQTPGQYTFVCESILRAYNDGVIRPLAEYQKR